MLTRLQLMKIHSLLAAFIFPVALMFMITGALYTWGVKGSYLNENFQIQLTKPAPTDIKQFKTVAESELTKLGLNAPTGKAKIKRTENSLILEWSGSSKNISLELITNTSTATLTIHNASWYRKLVQLHKAKGGIAFKIYAALFALSIIILLLSGFIMAWQTPKLKKQTLITAFIGMISFIIFISLS